MATVQGQAQNAGTLSSSDRNTVFHKIHLRGLEDFGPEDITSYVTEHFSSEPPERVERIDGTSANIVYKTPAVAVRALGQITSSTIADGSFSLSQLRAAKTYSTRPNASLQVRLALATDQKDLSEFYGLSYLRVQQAALYSRHAPTAEWQRLGDSYECDEEKDGMTVPFNVQQIRFTTDFVQVEQHGKQYKRMTGQKGSSLIEDEFRWQVKFPLETLTDVKISEAKVEGRLVVTIRFKLQSAPQSADNSEKAMARITGEASDNEMAKNLEEQEVLEDADMEEKSSDEGEIAEENPLIEDRPATYPLARLFGIPETSEGMEIRLVFLRSGAGSTSPYKWIWPAVIRFFGSREKWIPIKKKAEFNQIWGIEKFKLDEWLGDAHNPKSCGARISREQVAEDRCEWVLGPLRRSQGQSSANPAIQVSQGSSNIGGKRKREEKAASEIDDSNVLDAEIISSWQYVEERERIWRQKRQEEAKAGEDYVAAVKQLEKLRNQRDNAINKRSC